MLLVFYAWRLRRQRVLELLAGGGVAAGVALMFGVLVANAALTGPTNEILHGLAGSAQLELAARSSDGFDESLLAKVKASPGVMAAAPLLSESATIAGPKGRRSVDLIGVTADLVRLDSHKFVDSRTMRALQAERLGLAPGIAAAVGVPVGGSVGVLAGGSSAAGPSFRLGGRGVHFLASSAVAVASLALVQALAGDTGRVTQILVETYPGKQRAVAKELRVLAAGRIDVEPVGSEVRRLDATAAPNSRSTVLFAAVGAAVGLLLTLNAMLLVVPERRRFLADLRMQGFEARQIAALLGFQVLTLGIVASLLGIGLGDVLSRTLLRESPAYLAFAFPVGTRDMVHVGTVLLVLGCGLLTTFLASLPVFLDLRPRRPVEVVSGGGGDAVAVGASVTRRLGWLGVALVLVPLGLFVLFPGASAIGDVMLALATLCLIPVTFAVAIKHLASVAERLRGSMLAVAVAELRATPLHAIGLAGVAAVAVYGSVTISGAQRDLTHGLTKANTEFFATADIWVTSSANEFITASFSADGTQRAISRARGVAAVRVYQGGLLDVGVRRMWIRARSPKDRRMVEVGQVLEGSPRRANALIRGGGWAAVSSGFADERELRVGDRFVLPTPAGPVRFGLAAITTNFGWSPGVITIDSGDYRRYWSTNSPTALEVDLKPGTSVASGLATIRRAIGRRAGLQVRSAGELDASFDHNVEAGLRSLGEISALLLIAAALAIAAALSATIWRRRARFASLKIQGFDRSRIWRAIMLESAIVLGLGCGLGLLLGMLGHALANDWLELTTGFPAPFALDVTQMLFALLLVFTIALAVVVLPGVGAARVSPRVAFEE